MRIRVWIYFSERVVGIVPDLWIRGARLDLVAVRRRRAESVLLKSTRSRP